MKCDKKKVLQGRERVAMVKGAAALARADASFCLILGYMSDVALVCLCLPCSETLTIGMRKRR